MINIFSIVFAPIFALLSFGQILAQATGGTDGGVDWISYILNGGPFAIVVLLIILDKLAAPGERDRLRAENETLREEIRTLNEHIRHEIVPPLVQLNSLMKDVIEEIGGKTKGSTTRGR